MRPRRTCITVASEHSIVSGVAASGWVRLLRADLKGAIRHPEGSEQK